MSVDRRFVVAAVLLAVVIKLVLATREADEAGADHKQVHAAGRALVDEIRTSMIGSIALPREGVDWMRQLDLDAAPPIRSTSLPRSTTARTFGREPAPGDRTGNALLFASPMRRIVMRSAVHATHRIQIHRLVAYYLTETSGGPRVGKPGGLELARFVSVRVVDGDQIDAISDAVERVRILRTIAGNRGEHSVTWVWRRRGDHAGLYRIDPSTGALRAGERLPADPSHSSAALLSALNLAVASNFADPGSGVASLARRSEDRGGFPHGFEVQLTGASTRQVMVHLTLTTTRSTAPVTADLRGIALVRES